MRLHYLLGDPARALQVYEDNRQRRRAALDHEPLPETQALARDIGRGTVGALPAHSPIPPLAQRVGRPPLVAGTPSGPRWRRRGRPARALFCWGNRA